MDVTDKGVTFHATVDSVLCPEDTDIYVQLYISRWYLFCF